ncbi:hypothetical protein Hanom_Chr03g00238201 [Helianthus anomalus]
MSFAFDTFGPLAPEAINFLTRVQWVIHNNCSTPGGRGLCSGGWGLQFRKDWRRSLLPVYLLF